MKRKLSAIQGSPQKQRSTRQLFKGYSKGSARNSVVSEISVKHATMLDNSQLKATPKLSMSSKNQGKLPLINLINNTKTPRTSSRPIHLSGHRVEVTAFRDDPKSEIELEQESSYSHKKNRVNSKKDGTVENDFGQDLEGSMDIDSLLNKYRKVIERKSSAVKPKTANREARGSIQRVRRLKTEIDQSSRDRDRDLFFKTKKQIESGTFKFKDSDQSYISGFENQTLESGPEESLNRRQTDESYEGNTREDNHKAQLDKTPVPRYSPSKHPHPSGSEKEFDFSSENEQQMLSPSNIEFCINPQKIPNGKPKNFKTKKYAQNVVPTLDINALKRFRTKSSFRESEISYKRLVDPEASKIDDFEQLEAKLTKKSGKQINQSSKTQKKNSSKHHHLKSRRQSNTSNLKSGRSIKFAQNVAKSPNKNMKRKNFQTFNSNRGLKTPRSVRNGNKSMIYSGNGSGAILSNRRGRFWNSNVGGPKSGRKSVSPMKQRVRGNVSSSKKYNQQFVSKMENLGQEIDEFKVEVDQYITSPQKALHTVSEFNYKAKVATYSGEEEDSIQTVKKTPVSQSRRSSIAYPKPTKKENRVPKSQTSVEYGSLPTFSKLVQQDEFQLNSDLKATVQDYPVLDTTSKVMLQRKLIRTLLKALEGEQNGRLRVESEFEEFMWKEENIFKTLVEDDKGMN